MVLVGARACVWLAWHARYARGVYTRVARACACVAILHVSLTPTPPPHTPTPSQLRGVVPPKSKEDAGLYLDMLEDLIASVRALVNRALELSTAASTYSAPQDAAAQRALLKANRTALDAQKVAWERVHFAERNIVNKVTGMAATDIFLQFVSEDLNWDSQDYIVHLQGLVRRVVEQREIMEHNFPEKPSPIVYALSTGGQRLKRSRGGSPGYDFDPVQLAWLAAAPFGEFKSRRLHLQQEYGCGHSALDTAVREYRLNQARADDLFDGDDHEYRHNVVHYDSEGNLLLEEDEASIAEKVAKVRHSNLHLGRYNMLLELRRAYPTTYFSMYRIAKILSTKDFSRRIWWSPVIVRTNIWSPYPFFSLHLDGNEKAIRCGVHVTGLVDACSGAVIMLQPLPAKRGELIAAEVITALSALGGFVPRLLRCDSASVPPVTSASYVNLHSPSPLPPPSFPNSKQKAPRTSPSVKLWTNFTGQTGIVAQAHGINLWSSCGGTTRLTVPRRCSVSGTNSSVKGFLIWMRACTT